MVTNTTQFITEIGVQERYIKIDSFGGYWYLGLHRKEQGSN
jgi:hypothetical protein